MSVQEFDFKIFSFAESIGSEEDPNFELVDIVANHPWYYVTFKTFSMSLRRMDEIYDLFVDFCDRERASPQGMVVFPYRDEAMLGMKITLTFNPCTKSGDRE